MIEQSAPAADVIRLRVGISEPVNTVLAIWMAQDAGRYAGHGLSIEIVDMNGGSRGAAALAAGDLDAMHVGLSAVARLNRDGANLRIVAALANVVRFTFISALAVTDAAALRGGVVAVTAFGSESDAIATLALKRLGLDRADVTVKECGGAPQRLAALQSGEIAASAFNEPFASVARERGLNVLLDLVPERIPWLFTGIAVRRADIERRREVLTRFIRATAEGNRIALADEAQARTVLAARAGIRDSATLDAGYRDFRELSPPDIAPTSSAADNVLAQCPGASRDPADHIDMSILGMPLRQGV